MKFDYSGLDERVGYYQSLVPELFRTGKFPVDFRLAPTGWVVPNDVIDRPYVETVVNGSARKIRPISTMDVEFMWNELIDSQRAGNVDTGKRDYGCGLGCPHCFSEEDVLSDTGNLMKWQEVVDVIDHAKAIGLRSIKFLGPGELLQNPDLFDILNAVKQRGIEFGIFTKGAELGSDELALYIHGKGGLRDNGVTSAMDFVDRLMEYENVRLYFGFNSFMPDVQDKMTGSFGKVGNYRINPRTKKFENRGVENYTEKRDRALVNLTHAGLNDPSRGQRFTLVATPTYSEQLPEMPEIYAWAAKRNMPLVVAPTMESGPRSTGLAKLAIRTDPQHDKLVDLYVAIYSRAIEERITTIRRIDEEGISAYMGTAHCNQVANGLYMRVNGQVKMCPGNSKKEFVYGNVHDAPLADIWYNSPNYQMGALKNHWCLAKTDVMPSSLQGKIMERLASRYI